HGLPQARLVVHQGDQGAGRGGRRGRHESNLPQVGPAGASATMSPQSASTLPAFRPNGALPRRSTPLWEAERSAGPTSWRETMFDRFRDRRSFRGSPTLKLMIMGGLVLLLLIPLSMVGSLVYEREHRRDEAVHEVAAMWGEAQTLAGPLLTVPFREALRETLPGHHRDLLLAVREGL